MNNKKNENFYGINLNNLRKEYNDINNPKRLDVTYSFWKNHIIYRIEGNEFIIENLLHYLINEERKKKVILSFGQVLNCLSLYSLVQSFIHLRPHL